MFSRLDSICSTESIILALSSSRMLSTFRLLSSSGVSVSQFQYPSRDSPRVWGLWECTSIRTDSILRFSSMRVADKVEDGTFAFSLVSFSASQFQYPSAPLGLPELNTVWALTALAAASLFSPVSMLAVEVASSRIWATTSRLRASSSPHSPVVSSSRRRAEFSTSAPALAAAAASSSTESFRRLDRNGQAQYDALFSFRPVSC
mmetsp:Transcript_12191/g.35707  ORF Transcript_12191/g.35707 Transcript_12191/m.35707 type:complete len:204 (+) Transcript_12191:459-1070(+)